ncbi:MAG: CoA pyrophosphatase [Rhodocyclales bacterium]|nr:CoA pyrophosphatase [Rhodocyclales bacterium]
MFSTAELRARFADGSGEGTIVEPGASLPVLTPAAVLVPIVARASGMTVLLTQRTAHLRDHAGQVSFPGGRSEPADATPVATALREAEEEVGLAPAQVEVLGCLPQYLTGTGFRITPVVGLVTPPLNLRLDDFEVAEVFEPPLDFLLDAANHQRHRVEYQGALREYWAMPWQGYYIWGATAGMLVSLHRFLRLG